MHLRTSVFKLPKAGNSDDEYEDAWQIGTSHASPAKSWRSVSIADGATESSFSRRWAELLVADCVRAPQTNMSTLRKRLGRLQRVWQEELGSRSLPWYAEERVREGAYAALLWFTVSEQVNKPKKSQHWRALAIGDSCLFQLREEVLSTRFPFEQSSEFTNRPLLICSREDRNQTLWAHPNTVKRLTGRWQTGDVFFLMTDALAAWFLRQVEQMQTPWECLVQLHQLAQTDASEAQNQFVQIIADQRTGNRPLLRNDDVTLVVLEMAEHSPDSQESP